MSVPFAEPKYTGLAITRPSACSNFGTVSFTRSSKTHLPIAKQLPQPVQPRIALFPTVTISDATSASSKIFFISFSAIAVFPFRFGLPLIINTFISYSPDSLICCLILLIRSRSVFPARILSTAFSISRNSPSMTGFSHFPRWISVSRFWG